MEQVEPSGQSATNTHVTSATVERSEPSPLDIPAKPASDILSGQATPLCATCGAAGGALNVNGSFVYAVGQVEWLFPDPSVEREVAQATGRAETAGQTDRQAFRQVLAKRENRYLARQLCWVLTIQGMETYFLLPRDPADLDLLIEAIHEPPWISTVIGVRGPIAPPEYCNGLMVPIVMFDQIYTFSREALIEAIPRPPDIPAERFEAAAREVLHRILQVDNAGSTDGHRAWNYLVTRYPPIFSKTAEEFARDFSLTSVETRPSNLGGTRNVVEAIVTFTERKSAFTEKFFVRVDVTGKWPYLFSALSPFWDR
jgi:PatG Domain